MVKIVAKNFLWLFQFELTTTKDEKPSFKQSQASQLASSRVWKNNNADTARQNKIEHPLNGFQVL